MEEGAPPPRSVTQKQIAERVGVSQQLVTLALKGSPLVAAKSADKILAMAKELGYGAHANRHARAMAASRHGIRIKHDILAVIFDVSPLIPTITAPYFMQMVDGVELEVGERKIDLFLVRRTPTSLPWLIRERAVDGVLLLGAASSAAEISKLDIPVLTLGTHANGIRGVAPDSETGIRATTRHLIELGHTRIAYLGPRLDWPASRARFKGYKNALHEAGMPFEEVLVDTTLHEALDPLAQEGMARLLLRTKFTAVVCYNDPVAMGAIRFAKKRGLHIPHDVSVTGFDDVSVAAGFKPAITSVGFSSVDMGRAAVRRLLDGPVEPLHEEFPVDLEIRRTTAPPRSLANR
jgi:LacI family transcriptional regulator